MNRLAALLLTLAVILGIVTLVVMIAGCITVERIQVGPDHWPGATTQPTEIERKIWEDYE